jgi:sulfite oxidase
MLFFDFLNYIIQKKAIEPFWHLYRQHFATDLPMRLMEDMIIGKLDEKSQDEIDDMMDKIMDENEDPYAHEPKRDEKLIVHGDTPMNAEVPSDLITNSYITPTELFYIRHHHPVPLLMDKELKEFEIEVDVSAFEDYLSKMKEKKESSSTTSTESKCKLSLDDIKKLPKVEVTTTLQCSGNRRGDMNSVKRTSGTAWGQGAISTATWSGARLVDVLKLAGVDNPYELTDKDGTQKHVRFESLDGMKASINMEKATNPYGDVIIAYEMNGEPIPREHGFPLRAIVPGYSAVRNVKWVKKIELSTEESEGAWQRGLNYKTLPPSVTDAKTVNLNAMPSMTESSLFSGITKMEAIKDDNNDSGTVMIKVKGWAWAGGGRNVVRVDVTSDDGNSWTTADIVKGGDQKFGRAWAWVFWECEVPAKIQKDGTVSLASKAVDMAFNSQPENADHGWNVRGLGNNSWYRTELKI